METDAKRAERRKAMARRKAKAMEQLRPQLDAERKRPPLHAVNVARAVGIIAHTRTRCSCPMCGNYRKYGKGDGKLTLAECKARLDERD